MHKASVVFTVQHSQMWIGVVSEIGWRWCWTQTLAAFENRAVMLKAL